MKACTDPKGHQWEDISFETRAGSTPVICVLCREPGFRINNQVIEPNVGQPGEELF